MHRDKELFAATYIIEIIIYATYLVFQFENKYYFDANIKSKIRYLGPYLVILYLSQTELKFSSCHSVQ